MRRRRQIRMQDRRMGCIYQRGGKLIAAIKDVTGVWRYRSTGLDVGQETEAKKWLAEREAKVARELAVAGSGALTVARYANAWLKKRTTKTVEDDRTRIERHVLPHIGHMLLADVKPRHLRDLVEQLKREGKLAPMTIRKTTGVLHSMFKSAVIEELIVTNPCIFERGVLPRKADKDPTWRAQAIYTRVEIERLLSDPSVPHDRRVLYALKFFVGRHSEVARLTWGAYDTETSPLGRLSLGYTKSGVPREIPVHKTLAKVLAQWKLTGFEALLGRKPTAEDLIVPTRNGTQREAAESQHQLEYDLETLKMRVKAGERRKRRGHDLRRTFITLARSDGAIDGLLRLVTHGPRPNEILDVYSTPPWENLCGEVAKVRVELREGTVAKLAAVD